MQITLPSLTLDASWEAEVTMASGAKHIVKWDRGKFVYCHQSAGMLPSGPSLQRWLQNKIEAKVQEAYLVAKEAKYETPVTVVAWTGDGERWAPEEN